MLEFPVMNKTDASTNKTKAASGAHRRLPKAWTVNVAVIAICIIVLIPLLVIGIYDRPSADDFGYSMLTHQVFQESGGNPLAVLSAAVQTSAHYYNTWQGLYTSAFLLALQPGIAGSQFYPIGAYLIIAFIFAMCLYLAYCVERHALHTDTKLWPAVGCLLATLFIQCMPYANEGIYWYNGAANYTPIFFATFASIGLCITALSVRKRWQRVLAIVAATLVSFVISGGNYMPAFFNLMVMVAFTGIGFLKRRPALALPLISSIAGFAISAMAPGTAIRQSILTDMFGHPTVVGTLFHSVYRALMDLRLFIDLPVIVFLVAMTPLIVLWARRAFKAGVGFSGKVLVLAGIASFIFMVGTLCVPFYAAGSFGEGRTRDAAFFVDLTLVAGLYGYAVCLIATRIDEFAQWADRAVRHLSVPVICLITVLAVGVITLYGSSVAGSGNSLIAARSLASGEAQQYAAEYDAREAILLAAREGTGEGSGASTNVGNGQGAGTSSSASSGQGAGISSGTADGQGASSGQNTSASPSAGNGEATITTLTVRPQLLFFSDVLRNEDDWSDELAEYYGLKHVTIIVPEGFDRYVTFDY